MRNFIRKYIGKGKADIIGDGYWSNRPMQDLKIRLAPQKAFWFKDVDEMGNPRLVGQLNVYFNSKDWDVKKYGLIYTDSLFLVHLKRILKKIGFQHFQDITYSEQGMQGNDFVNFDVGKKLATELNKKGFIEIIKISPHGNTNEVTLINKLRIRK